jgi:hypothetical protein
MLQVQPIWASIGQHVVMQRVGLSVMATERFPGCMRAARPASEVVNVNSVWGTTLGDLPHELHAV